MNTILALAYGTSGSGSVAIQPFYDSADRLQVPSRAMGVMAPMPSTASNWAFFGFLLTLVIFTLLLSIAFVFVKSVYLSGDRATKTEFIKRGYFYIMSFVSLGVIYLAFSDLLRVILNNQSDNLSGGYYYPYTTNYFSAQIAFRAAIVTITLPIFLIHWLRTSTKPVEQTTAEKTTFLKERRSYSGLILFLYSVPGVLFGASLIYHLFLLLLSPNSVMLSSFALPFSYTFTMLGIWLYHYRVFKVAEADLKK